MVGKTCERAAGQWVSQCCRRWSWAVSEREGVMGGEIEWWADRQLSMNRWVKYRRTGRYGASSQKCLLLWHHFLSKIVITRTFS